MADWNEKLFRRTIRRTRETAADSAVTFAIVIAVSGIVLTFIVVALNAADMMSTPDMEGLSAQEAAFVSLAAVIFAVALFFAVQLMRTYLEMLYEARETIGVLADPVAPAGPDHRGFTCVLHESGADGRLVSLRVTAAEATGRFRARVAELQGVEADHELPWDIRWRDYPGERHVHIAGGDSEMLEVVKIRSARALEFLCPSTPDDPSGIVKVRCADPGDRCVVRVRLGLFNEAAEPAASQHFELSMRFESPVAPPMVDLVSLAYEPPSA